VRNAVMGRAVSEKTNVIVLKTVSKELECFSVGKN